MRSCRAETDMSYGGYDTAVMLSGETACPVSVFITFYEV